MTDNMKKFLEAVSDDQEFIGKLTKAETAETMIALAAEKGFTLTEEDLKKPEITEGAVSDDEIDAVAGGKICVCALGGGGEADNAAEQLCVCVAGGGGKYNNAGGTTRCICIAGGYGYEAEVHSNK